MCCQVVWHNGIIHRDEPLGLSWRFEPLYPPLPLASGLVRILRSDIQVPVLAMFPTRQEFPLRRIVVLELISHNHARDILQALEQLTENRLRGRLVPPALPPNVEDSPLLIDCTAEAMAFLGEGGFHRRVRHAGQTLDSQVDNALASCLREEFPQERRFLR